MDDKMNSKATAGDIIRLSIIGLQLVLNIIAIWRENRDAISKKDITDLIDTIDRDRKVF